MQVYWGRQESKLCVWVDRNATVLGWTNNTGNPVHCSDATDDWVGCVPLVLSCGPQFNIQGVPDEPGPGWRTVPAAFTLGKYRQTGINLADNEVVDSTFVNFDHGDCWEVRCVRNTNTS